jgi:hypothetical protein
MSSAPPPPAILYQALGANETSYLLNLARQHARAVHSRGRTLGSMEPEETAGLNYSAASCLNLPPPAWRIYRQLGANAQRALDHPLRIILPGDTDAGYAFALNVLNPGQRYELHRDTAAWNLIVFLTGAHSRASFHLCSSLSEPIIRIHPIPGVGVLFDGVTLPHYSDPNDGTNPRVALVCQYPDPTAEPLRSDDYLAHLYGNET